MRGPRKLASGLAAAAALVLLAGCGSSGGTRSASGTTSSSSAPAGAQGVGCCGQARAFAAQVASTVGGGAQSPDFAQSLQQLAGQLSAITPPSEIATDWRNAVDQLQKLGQVFQGKNLNDPQQAAQVQQEAAPIEQQLSASADHIDAYLQTTCGIGETSGSAGPTS